MAKAQSIAPFPSDINRDDFGHWLSGFVDGEGCFELQYAIYGDQRNREHFHGRFILCLRRDDLAILETIQSYLGCGTINTRGITAIMRAKGRDKPQAILRIERASDLHDVLVPHFEKHPLRAKKQRDFSVWKAGVEILYHVACRPRTPRGYHQGTFPKWTSAERNEYRQLVILLKKQREFEVAGQINFPPRKTTEERCLFDQEH